MSSFTAEQSTKYQQLRDFLSQNHIPAEDFRVLSTDSTGTHCAVWNRKQNTWSFWLVSDLTAPKKAANPHDDLQHSLVGIPGDSGVQTHWSGDMAPVFVSTTVDFNTGSNVFVDDPVLSAIWPTTPLSGSLPTSLSNPTCNFTVLYLFEFECFTSILGTTGELVITDNLNNAISSVLGFDTQTRQVGSMLAWDHGGFASMSALHKVRVRAIGAGTVTLGRRDFSAIALVSGYTTNI